MDFSNITKEHILQAFKQIDNNGIPPHAQSSFYDVLYGEKRYPPKLVFSLAYEYANNKSLSRNDFEGGINTPCFNLLESLGFKIMNKNQKFYPFIEKFIEQAQTENLKTKEYISFYEDLKVVVSFGKGNSARIPWISFLYDGQSTSNGIYPVYLYYKSHNLLILAYGISETTPPKKKWIIDGNTETIERYFSKKGFKPERYGSSYVFKSYNIEEISPSEINQDLNDLIQQYKKQMTIDLPPIEPKQVFDITKIPSDLKKTGLLYDEKLIYRFVQALLTKPFVILSGLSGSGKTKLALAFAKWICEDESQMKLIPVGADWTNREYLLGYPNALDAGSYISPENKTLDIILEADKNPSKPYFLILDEMNLSYVERYFADFLSAMESREEIPLHPETEIWEKCKIPAKVKLPDNLFIIGTINVDETTYMFSPKVLDRASVIEFRVSNEEMSEFLSNIQPLNINAANRCGANMAFSFVELANRPVILEEKTKTDITGILLNFFSELKKAGAEFGYRTATDIYRFMAISKELNLEWDDDDITDAVIIQKLLPKVHGSRKKIQPILESLWSLCLKDDALDKKIESIINADEIPTLSKYPISAEKILRMYNSANDNGFTSFSEA